MAYQNVGIPRFYINVLEWLDSHNLINQDSNISVSTGDDDYDAQYVFKPEIINTFPVLNTVQHASFFPASELHGTMSGDNNFHAILNAPAADTLFSFQSYDNYSNVVNMEQAGTRFYGSYDGFRIATFTGGIYLEDLSGSPANVKLIGAAGSMIVGTYYDMPNAPDLSLTMEREYSETKEITTYDGSSMSNTMGNKASSWGSRGAWELGDTDPALSRSGRRIWNLKFSYMDDGDLWGSNQTIGTDAGQNFWYPGGLTEGTTEGYGDDTISSGMQYNLLTDDNFFSQVWHRTLGGTIPFIFQPDAPVLNETTGEYEGGNNNPDQFAICKIRDNSMKATQTAFNVYDMSMVIEEVW